MACVARFNTQNSIDLVPKGTDPGTLSVILAPSLRIVIVLQT